MVDREYGPEPEPEKRGFNPLIGLLVVLVLAVLAAGGALAWTFLISSEMSRRDAADAMTSLRRDWRELPAPGDGTPRLVDDPVEGRAEWILQTPSLGQGREWPVVVGLDHLERGVGWYPRTAQPGQVGNFVVSGHQASHGDPFGGWENLHEGQQVIVEASDATFTYTLLTSAGDLTVQADDTWVLDPVPGQPDAEAEQAFITLITHEDLIPTSDRAVVFGVLTATEMK